MPTVTDAWLDDHRVDPARLADEPLIGLGHVEAELRSLVARLAEPEKAAAMGADVPRGILLHGPPGIGKTHTARSLARRLGDIPLYEVVADELTGALVRQLFGLLAARHPRSILVVDEIDLVGGERSEADAGVRRTLAALLTALDGLRTAAGVLVVGASSRPAWELDAALLRSGRLGFTIELVPPDAEDRAALLRHFLSGRPLAGAIDHTALAALTDDWTPADLKAACADAAGLALAAGHDAIAEPDLLEALRRAGRVVPSPRSYPPLDAVTLHRVCVHEAGHLVAGVLLHGTDWLREVTIGDGAGTVAFGPPDRPIGDYTEDEARLALVTAFAGTAAERALLGAASLAHRRDVEGAAGLAYRLVTGGLQPSVPPLGGPDRIVERSAAASRAVDATEALLAAARESAAELVGQHRELVEQAAEHLEAEALRGLEADRRRPSVVLDPGPLLATVGLQAAAEPAAPAPVRQAVLIASRDGSGGRERPLAEVPEPGRRMPVPTGAPVPPDHTG